MAEDAGALDAGAPADAGLLDAGSTLDDAGSVDAGGADAGVDDAGAARQDAGVADQDAGVADAGLAVNGLVDGQLVSLRADDGSFLEYVQVGTIPNVERGTDVVPDATTRFLVTVLANGKVLLKASNGQYLSRVNRGGVDRIEALKATADAYCEFDVEPAGGGTVALRADSGAYWSAMTVASPLLLSGTTQASHFVAVSRPAASASAVSWVSGGQVSLRADDVNYLRVVTTQGIANVEAVSASVGAPERFTVALDGQGKVAFQASDGTWLSRVNRGTTDFLEAAKATPDAFCWFQPVELGMSAVALRADNGQLVSRGTTSSNVTLTVSGSTPGAPQIFLVGPP